MTASRELKPALACVDHLVFAARDLDEGIEHIERLLGVRAAHGGAHPGRGTHNALIALGPASYLEIIAPDPAQPAPPAGQRRWLGVDDTQSPRLTTWAAKATHLQQLAKHAAAHGIAIGDVRTGRRRLADGRELSWTLTDAPALIAGGVVPFFIDWGGSPHPAHAAPRGLELLDLRAGHPEPERIADMLRQVGIDMRIAFAERPELIATVRSPRGTIELR